MLISYRTNNGIATDNCKITSGGVTMAPTISKIKKAYFRDRFKKFGVTIPKLVRNITIIGNSKSNANGIVTRNKNLKYRSTVNNSLNMSSFKLNKKGKMSLINIK